MEGQCASFSVVSPASRTNEGMALFPFRRARSGRRSLLSSSAGGSALGMQLETFAILSNCAAIFSSGAAMLYSGAQRSRAREAYCARVRFRCRASADRSPFVDPLVACRLLLLLDQCASGRKEDRHSRTHSWTVRRYCNNEEYSGRERDLSRPPSVEAGHRAGASSAQRKLVSVGIRE